LALLTEPELGHMLTGFHTIAFRFETRDRYNSDVGREAFRRFLAGEPDDYAWHRSWVEMLRSDTEQGKLWQRVRIVSVPLSDWSRYAIEVARLSVTGGEDVRYLRRDVAEDLGLAPFDSWIFDGSLLVHLHFHDEDDRFRGAELIDDPGTVARHLQWRELALRHALPLEVFVASLA
jgi:hypothetical protein